MSDGIKVYAAFNAVPDFGAGYPGLKSLHKTFDGAKNSLFPDKDYKFAKVYSDDVWIGPDGYGMIKLMEIQD